MKTIQEYSLLLFIEIALVAIGHIVSQLYPDASILIWSIVLILSLLVIIWLLQLKSIKTKRNKIIVGIFIFITITGFGVLTILPKKSISCLDNEKLHHINWTIEEKNIQHFEQELRNLYSQLVKCDLKVPLIDPVNTGHPIYDNTWYGFHLTFLKVLRRQMRNNKFNFNQWNTDVNRENTKRKAFVEQHITSQ